MKNLAAFFKMASLSFLLLTCGMASGDNAVEKMNDAEKKYLDESLQKITPDLTVKQLIAILGPVYKGSGTVRPVWLAPGDDEKSRVSVYYLNNKIIKIRWVKADTFVWEKDFGLENKK
ncbi:MAG TPA: hypothetical protein P5346_12315 [Spirochaetota bacterium]|nr:hypothetical protein [Spirochaetota bacterium]